jgi:uncharacterized protein
MPYGFLDTLATPAVQAAQRDNNSRSQWEEFSGDRAFDRFTENEAAFIAARDSFYLASISESGWPYVQHRGGPPGFVKILDDRTLGFADFRGNRQYLSLGNIAADNRVALILVDYPNRARLKILGRLAAHDLAADPDLAGRLRDPVYRAVIERGFVLTLEAFDWNCAQHITPRYTGVEIAPSIAPFRQRIAELEAENRALRERLGEAAG